MALQSTPPLIGLTNSQSRARKPSNQIFDLVKRDHKKRTHPEGWALSILDKYDTYFSLVIRLVAV